MNAALSNVLLGIAAAAAVAVVPLSSMGPKGADIAALLMAGLVACAGVIARSPRFGTVTTAAFALACNAYLLQGKVSGAGNSSCSINQVLNCDLVNQSEASMLFGLPVTLYGVAFYAGLVIAGLGAARKDYLQVSAFFSVPSLLFSAYLGWETKKLGVLCLVCLSIYAANLLLLGAAALGLVQERRKLTDELGETLSGVTLLTISGVFALITLGGAVLWNGQQPGSGPDVAQLVQDGDTTRLKKMYSQPRTPPKLVPDAGRYGDPTAPYTILEWADFGCPHCARASHEIKQMIKQNPAIQVRFRPFPLTAACNPLLEGDDGPGRCNAAMAAYCAHQQGKFVEMTELLYENGPQFFDGPSIGYMAQQAGLDLGKFEGCMNDPATQQWVVQSAIDGGDAGVQGTPTFFLKGTHGEDWILVKEGTVGAQKLVEAHQDGIKLPPPDPFVQTVHE